VAKKSKFYGIWILIIKVSSSLCNESTNTTSYSVTTYESRSSHSGNTIILQNVQTCSGAHTVSYLLGSRGSFHRDKVVSTHCYIKNEWTYMSTPPYVFIAYKGKTLHFLCNFLVCNVMHSKQPAFSTFMLLPWRQKQQGALECCCIPIRLHGVTSQKTIHNLNIYHNLNYFAIQHK